MSVFEFTGAWLISLWQIFEVPLFTSPSGFVLTGAGILFGVFACCLLIWFLHTFFKRES